MNILVKRQTFRVDERGNLVEVPADTKWREAQEREEVRGRSHASTQVFTCSPGTASESARGLALRRPFAGIKTALRIVSTWRPAPKGSLTVHLPTCFTAS
jgi:hypothetical protein